MYVWRLETGDGLGAYRGTSRYGTEEEDWPSFMRLETAMWAAKGLDDPHPPPSRDGHLEFIGYKEFCGFESPRALADWFFREHLDGWRMEQLDLRVTVWKVKKKHVRKGRRQLVFKKHKAERVFTQSTVEFEGSLA